MPVAVQSGMVGPECVPTIEDHTFQNSESLLNGGKQCGLHLGLCHLSSSQYQCLQYSYGKRTVLSAITVL